MKLVNSELARVVVSSVVVVVDVVVAGVEEITGTHTDKHSAH